MPKRWNPLNGTLHAVAVVGVVALGSLTLTAPAQASPPGASSQGAPAVLASNTSPANCVKKVSATVKTAEKPLHYTLPSTPVKAKANKGKSVWLVTASLSDTANVDMTSGVRAAAKKAGLNLKVFNGNFSVSSEAQGISEAVSQHADGIILLAIDPSTVTGAVASANAQHVPMIDLFNGRAKGHLAGMRAHVTYSFSLGGKYLADYVLQQMGCRGAAVFSTSPGFLGLELEGTAIQQQFSSLCPACKLDKLEIPITTNATQAAPTVKSAIARTGAKWVLTAYDPMAEVLVPALRGSGVRLVSYNGVPANLDFIRKGDVQAADVLVPNTYMGWASVDEIERIMAGQPVAVENIPQQLVTKHNMPKSNAASSGLGNYQAAFARLWGLR